MLSINYLPGTELDVMITMTVRRGVITPVFLLTKLRFRKRVSYRAGI